MKFIGTRATQGGNTGTASKSQSNILVSLQKSWNLESRTEQACEVKSLVPEKEERPQLMLQIQIQFPSSVAYAPDCAPPESD